MMKFTIQLKKTVKIPQTCVVAGIFENGKLTHTAKEIDKASKGSITQLIKNRTFAGKIGHVFPLINLGNTQYKNILLVGCGPNTTIEASTFRKVLIGVAKALIGYQITNSAIFLTELEVSGHSLAWKVEQIVEIINDGIYQFNLFKTEGNVPSPIKEISIVIDDAKQQKLCSQALQQGLAISEAITFTKNLANLPSNICTPTYLANQARELSKQNRNIKVNVLSENDIRKLGMNTLLAVGQGSDEESKLICLQYNGGKKHQAPIAFVGKGVTFDTGGNSLKTPDNMVGMKYDMCGGATVLGVLKAVAQLKLPLNIVGIVPAVENMPGGKASKPEDIIKSMSGKTIEIISTDAEGRLILADALTYCERYKPETVIDIATLTGAVVIALGFHATGLLANSQPLANELLKAGEESNDRAWQLPLWDDYQEQLKSPFADISNVGGRMAGAITAGCFLSQFAKKFNWAHLDVAGTAAMMMGTSDRKATGRPIPMLMQFLINRAKRK